MKKFLYRIFLFGVLIGLLNVGYLFLIKKLDWNFSKRLEAISFLQPEFDCLVLGNSLPMDGINSEYFSKQGLNTYNLAIGGASLYTSHKQLQEYLDQYNYKPKYVVLGANSNISDFNEESIHPIVDFTNEDKSFSGSDLPMIKFRWIAKELLKKIVSPNHRNAKLVKGQLRMNKVVKDKTSALDTVIKFNSGVYEESTSLEKVAKLCRKNNIKLICIEMPDFKETRNGNNIGPFTLNCKSETVQVYNCNGLFMDSILHDNTSWLGDAHLNNKGAEAFTKFLFSKVKFE